MKRPRHRSYLVDPPRIVPVGVRLAALFSGGLAQLGWCIFAIGMAVFWMYFPFADLAWLYHAQNGTAKVRGHVVFSEETHASLNEQRVYRIEYEYSVPEYGAYSSESFRAGWGMKENSAVTVEYVPGKPSVSRISGTNRSPFGLWGSFIALFPTVGLVMAGQRLEKGRTAIVLMSRGKDVPAKLLSKQATNSSVNNEKVYKLTFSYRSDDGADRRLVVKTHKHQRLTDEDTKPLLYDPAQPDRAMLLDDIPGDVRLAESGHFACAGPSAGWSLVIPLLTVVGNGTYFVLGLFP